MTYAELREWFLDWMPDEPVPLDFETGITPDCRIVINNTIIAIDAILKNGKPNNLARTYKNRLEQIKKAIDEGKHDISYYRENGFKRKQ